MIVKRVLRAALIPLLAAFFVGCTRQVIEQNTEYGKESALEKRLVVEPSTPDCRDSAYTVGVYVETDYKQPYTMNTTFKNVAPPLTQYLFWGAALGFAGGGYLLDQQLDESGQSSLGNIALYAGIGLGALTFTSYYFFTAMTHKDSETSDSFFTRRNTLEMEQVSVSGPQDSGLLWQSKGTNVAIPWPLIGNAARACASESMQFQVSAVNLVPDTFSLLEPRFWM